MRLISGMASTFRFVLVEDFGQALAVELAVDASVDGEDGRQGAAAEAGDGPGFL